MNSDFSKEIVNREKIKGFYEHYVDVMGTSVGWSSPQVSQKVYTGTTNLSEEQWSTIESILDVGCGEGHLLPFLRDQKGFQGQYTGLEMVSFFYEKAVTLYGQFPKTEFIYDEFLTHDFGLQKFDWVIALGTFSMQQEEQQEYDFRVCQKMFSLARKRITIYLNDIQYKPYPEWLSKHPYLMYHDISEFVSRLQDHFTIAELFVDRIPLKLPMHATLIHIIL